MKSVVWLDRDEARVFHLSDERMERKVILARFRKHHTHRVNDQLESEALAFFREVAEHLSHTEHVLIVGPEVARQRFESFLKTQNRLLAERVVGSEAMDHPSDSEIAAYATRYFMNGGGGK